MLRISKRLELVLRKFGAGVVLQIVGKQLTLGAANSAPTLSEGNDKVLAVDAVN